MIEPESLKVPADFPRERCVGSVAGVQPKIAVLLIAGKFVEAPTDAELDHRYEACEDLVMQLELYCQRKLKSKPELDRALLHDNVRQGVLNKDWDVSLKELDWIMAHLSERMGWTSLRGGVGDESGAPEPVVKGFQLPENVARHFLANEQAPRPVVKTIVDEVREQLSKRMK
jgi:hypothetical protein